MPKPQSGLAKSKKRSREDGIAKEGLKKAKRVEKQSEDVARRSGKKSSKPVVEDPTDETDDDIENAEASVEKGDAENDVEDGAEDGVEDGVEEEQEVQSEPKSFADLGLIDSLCEACATLGYKKPTEIQEQAIPLALERDLIGIAETGSGKTAAFALPILQALINEPGAPALYGLVMVPTRELAFQVSQQFEALGSLIGVKCAVIVGGMDMMSQQIALSKRPHIVVATPGRLMDHLENTKGFSFRTLKYLVMDEADRLLDLDFGPVLDKILKILPRERRTYLFSATMSAKVDSLQRASLHNPLKVSVSKSSHQVVKTLMQRFMFIPHKYKDYYFVYLLTEATGKTCIVFTRTVAETQRLTLLIRALGFSAIPLHGQLSQSARLGALGKFRGGSRNILVATDVAARGLDIPSVDVVLNFDLPPDSKTYVHRVGRTARAGKSGKAISLVTQYDVEIWLRVEKALGEKVPVENVSKEDVMVLAQRVGEAQRLASKELQEMQQKGGHGRGRPRRGKKGRDDMDAEEG